MPDLHTVQIYGASDDLIEVEGDAPGCDEYPADDSACGSFLLVGQVDGKLAQAHVTARYLADGVWSIEVVQNGEGVKLLPCVIDSADDGYTAIACFDDVQTVTRVS